MVMTSISLAGRKIPGSSEHSAIRFGQGREIRSVGFRLGLQGRRASSEKLSFLPAARFRAHEHLWNLYRDDLRGMPTGNTGNRRFQWPSSIGKTADFSRSLRTARNKRISIMRQYLYRARLTRLEPGLRRSRIRGGVGHLALESRAVAPASARLPADFDLAEVAAIGQLRLAARGSG
jgi:hypothetical protein